MPVVTISSPVAAGGSEIARLVADLLKSAYLDQELLNQVALRLGATAAAVAERDERLDTLGQRISSSLRRLLESQASAVMLGDGFIESTGMSLLTRSYEEAAHTPITRADEIDDKRYIALLRTVIEDVADHHQVVIVGRAGQFILGGRSGAFHVRIVAPMAARIERLLHENGGQAHEVERTLRERDQAQNAWFRKYFKEDVRDAIHYDVVLNTAKIPFERCAHIIADLAQLAAQR